MTVYICSPYGGQEENYEKAKKYGRYAAGRGHVPIIPHTMLHGVLDDRISEQRTSGLELGKRLMTLCDAVWVFGEQTTPGMQGEINEAVKLGKPVEYIKLMPQGDGQAEAISLCLKEYSKYFTGWITSVITEDIAHFIRCGITDKLIIHCMGIAARSQKPWIYCKRILERCQAEKIYTLEEFGRNANKNRANVSNFSTHDINQVEELINRGYKDV